MVLYINELEESFSLALGVPLPCMVASRAYAFG